MKIRGQTANQSGKAIKITTPTCIKVIKTVHLIEHLTVHFLHSSVGSIDNKIAHMI